MKGGSSPGDGANADTGTLYSTMIVELQIFENKKRF